MDFCRSGSNSLLKQIQLVPVAHNHVQIDFEDLQEERLHYIPGQPVPMLSHPYSKNVFPHVQTAHTMFSFASIASCPFTGQH